MERGAGGGGVGCVGVGAGRPMGVGRWGQEELVGCVVVHGLRHVLRGEVVHHRHHGVVDGYGGSWRRGKEA